MQILFLNWKDSKHPLSGGAETVTQIFAEELAKKGHQITLFTSFIKSHPSQEIIRQVKVIRNGNKFTVYLQAFLFYKKHHNDYDIVIDQIHGMPFFTPLYVQKPILTYIHEIAGVIWFKEFCFPVAVLGYLIEKLYFKIYQKTTFLTDTNSMARALEKYAINPEKIHVLPLTIYPQPQLNLLKSKNPLLLYLGRITPMKRIELILEAAKIIKHQFPALQVFIAGKAKSAYVNYLKGLTQKSGLNHEVKFIKHVSDKQKFILFKKAWLNILPSVKEGFGLTVLEAATQSTPTLAFNVPGLCDTIINGKNGYLISPCKSRKLAEVLINLLSDDKKLTKLQNSSFLWSKKLPKFSALANKLETLLKQLVYKTAS